MVLGLDYQARYFWIEACRLFYESPIVARVSIERREFHAFDDVVTRYQQPIYDDHSRLIEGDHVQNKFRTDYAREIVASDLASPAFIGASEHSLLDRLAQATGHGQIPHRMTLVTPWRIDNNDALRKVISADGSLVGHHLFDGTGKRSAMGRVRETWRAAMGNPNDDQMWATLKHLRIWDGKSRPDLDEMLSGRLARAGLAPVDPTSLVHRYETLATGFMTGNQDHDLASLEAIVRQEGLWIGLNPVAAEPAPIRIGIKSYSRFAFNLEDDALVLNLVPMFHGREKASEVDWDRDVWREIREFLETRVVSGAEYDLHLDAHLSIGFAAGYALDKADALITPVQRDPGGGRSRWSSDGAVQGKVWDEVTWINVGEGPEIAVALEVTQDARDDVAAYVKRELPAVGRIACLRIVGTPSRESVRDGAHAHAVALEAATTIRDLRSAGERHRPLHLFAAAPVGLMFLLGRQAAPWGALALYEFNFGAAEARTYQPSIHLPQP